MTAEFRVHFEAASAVRRTAGLVVSAAPLGAEGTEELFAPSAFIGSDHGVDLFRSGGLLIGHVREPFDAAGLALRSQAAYERIFAAAGSRPLFRIWNYVPRINEVHDGLENYRAFCVGRSRAFEHALGGGFTRQLPAASAVGCGGDELVMIFVAGETAPRHFENPAQIPAYEYPAEHGPRPPSFARATIATDGGRRFAFISGTSAIRGHETIAAGSFEAQLDCTLDNLRLISRAAGLGDDLRVDEAHRRHFKVYLRHPSDYARARKRLERALVTPADAVNYLQAGICRAALDVEIEATIVSGP